MKYKTVKARDDEKWDEFVLNSPEGSIFATSSYLGAYDHIEKFFIVKGQLPKAAVYLPVNDKNEVISRNFLIHCGIIFEPQAEQTTSKYNITRYELSEYFVEEILSNYDAVKLSLHHGVQDLRPFLWHNYHEPEKEQITAAIRYTSHVDISELFLRRERSKSEVFCAIDSIRRKDVVKALKENLDAQFEYNPDIVKDLYRKTMLKSEATNIDEQVDDLGAILDNLHKDGLGFQVTICRDGQPSYCAYFSLYKHIACYLFAAGDPEVMQRNDAAFCVWNGFLKASELGAHTMDMEGINSPQRGDFKLRFGGNITPYYAVYK